MSVDRCVDVVIPTVARASLARALESVAQQSVPTNRIVVVADSSAEPAARAMAESFDASVVVGDRWRPGRARNEGMWRGSAKYVAFLDDDDWWEPTKLEQQVAVLDEHPTAPLSFTDTWFVRSDSTVRVPHRQLQPHDDLLDFVLSRRRLRYGDGFVQSSSLLVRRECAVQQPWDSDLPKHEDWDFVVRLCRRFGPPQHVREPLVWVPQGSSGSLSKTADPMASKEWLAAIEGSHRSRETGDFLATEVLRAHLQRREFSAAAKLIPELIGTRPHLAAVVVGVSGLVPR